MSRHRQDRGARTQNIAAEYLRRVWNAAYSPGRSVPGKDVRRTPGVSVEVKATAANPLGAALRQAAANAEADEFPLVVWRMNGQGETNPGEWIAAVRLDDMIALLLGCGYGDEVAA